MVSLFLYAIALILTYLLGTIPTGVLVAKRLAVDLTKTGSGNVGAANALRVLGWKAALVVLLGDCAKGFLAVLVCGLLSENEIFIASSGVAVVLGHCYSLPGYLKGGKGVATGLGVLLAASPLCAVIVLLGYGAILTTWKMAALASLSAAILTPIVLMLLDTRDATVIEFVLIVAVVCYRHKDNLTRIMQGNEPKVW